MSQSNRLASGGLVDRSRDIAFAFDCKTFSGHPGDTLASALVANGVKLVGRSFKYHRPRGLLAAGPEEPNALVELRSGARREPNAKATTVELFDGLEARSQNRWPSLAVDLMAVNRLAAPVFAAGFYYKTFMWPAAFWERLYEPLIRRAAGLGRAAEAADPDQYEKTTAHCDVLVIGSGPAGLAAALAAGRTGARVILAEEDFVLGGRLLSERTTVGGEPAAAWAAHAEAELESLPEVTILRRTAVFGVYDGGVYGAIEKVSDHLAVPAPHQPRQRYWRIVARRAVLGAGAIERPIVFGNNDRPGVMLAGAVRTYLNRFAASPGKRAVVYANNDDAARTVRDLAAAGCEIAAVIDARGEASGLHAAAKETGATLVFGGSILRAEGGREVKNCEVATASGATFDVPCDLIAVSGGWNPSVQLTSHQGARPRWDERLAAFLPGETPPGMIVAGAAAGKYGLGEALGAGARAGAEAAQACGFSGPRFDPPATEPEPGETAHGTGPWRAPKIAGKAFVDFQNDVSVSDIELSAREGFVSVEHLKRYTTLGMATDQGKTANVVGLALMAEITGRSIPETGVTLARPPYAPVAIGALGGAHRGKEFKPTRLPPSHFFAEDQGAVFVETGQWMRAAYFPRPGETDWLQTVIREVNTVRSAVGVYDASTLGKIDVQGTDAAAFLDRVYVNAFSSLAVGKARYGLMLREDGVAMDDGTTTRLSDAHYYMTTTTGGAAGVMRHLEFCRQWLWPELDVHLASVTDQWAQFAIAGPRSREVVASLVDGQDVSNEALPYMGARELTVCGGVQARLFRLSFSGELAYELAVPARYGDAMIRRIMEAGKPFGVCPYGAEALAVMRIEKGHAAGPELNGNSGGADLGMGRMMSKKKDFVGRALSAREAFVDPARPRLVGLRPVDRAARLRSGAHLVARGAEAVAANDEGYVTSTAYSPSNGHWIGLAFLARGEERMGEIVRACDPLRGADLEVEVVSPVFVDPEGARLRA
jgi:heterotetrameric sarcosine oxidase alpha subunit